MATRCLRLGIRDPEACIPLGMSSTGGLQKLVFMCMRFVDIECLYTTIPEYSGVLGLDVDLDFLRGVMRVVSDLRIGVS